MPQIREYLDNAGRSLFGLWSVGLDASVAVRVIMAVKRLEGGNTSAAKSVGGGVHELRLDFGPGYRVYLGLDGETLVILLGGSTKRRQDAAIAEAKACWKDYRARKRCSE